MANVKQMKLIRGHQGSGKSTYARTVYPNYVHIEADMYFLDDEGQYHFDPMLLKKAHAWCFEEAWITAFQEKNMVISNTFSQWWEMRLYVLLADKYGYELSTHRCLGEYRSIHNVPEAVVRRTKNNYQSECKSSKFDPRDDHFYFFNGRRDYDSDGLFPCTQCSSPSEIEHVTAHYEWHRCKYCEFGFRVS